jgi:hypothetical protein
MTTHGLLAASITERISVVRMPALSSDNTGLDQVASIAACATLNASEVVIYQRKGCEFIKKFCNSTPNLHFVNKIVLLMWKVDASCAPFAMDTGGDEPAH